LANGSANGSGGPPPSSTDTRKASPWPGLLTEAAKSLTPVLLTGASLIGFVAFAGAVIVWTRFEAIHVPADQAVKAVPRSELVATGSSLLLLFGFFGVLAVLATYLVDRDGRATPGMSRALLLLVAAEGIIVLVLAEGAPDMARVAIGLGFLASVGLALLATFDRRFTIYEDRLTPREGEQLKAVRGPDSLHTEAGKLRFSIWLPTAILLLVTVFAVLVALLVLKPPDGLLLAATLVGIAVSGVATGIFLWGTGAEIEESRVSEERHRQKVAEKIAATKTRQQKRRERKRRKRKREEQKLWNPRPHRLILRFWGVCLLVALALGAIVLPAVLLHEWWLAASFGAAMILAAGVWRVAVLSKTSFMWYGLVVFLSVPLFGTCTLMARNFAHPQVQPLALIRSTDGPGESIQGIYVTEGSDRVYFANVATEGCDNEVEKNSGRLLWVPKDEVVAMSIGPLQDVDEAGRSALEMAYALTPDVETLSGERVDLSVGTESAVAAPRAAEPPTGDDIEGGTPAKPQIPGSVGGNESEDDHRLESAGPAVRPNFGGGLELIPADAEPGDVVELRMSDPSRRVNSLGQPVNGFGPTPAGYSLRLNGVRLAVLRVPALKPRKAEYVRTVDGRVLPLDGYFERSSGHRRFVRLDGDSAIHVVDGDEEDGLSLKLSREGTLAPREVKAETGGAVAPSVILPNDEEVELEYRLLRRAWNPARIKFRVPDDAISGVVSVECGQLAGQPVLNVVHPPIARLAVRMRPGSQRVTFDSRGSDGAGRGESLARRWTIAGRHMGERRVISTLLPQRLGPYTVSLTVSDANGLSDTVALRLLRLPPSVFPLGSDRPKSEREVHRVREALRAAVGQEKPAAIELDGHADAVGPARGNLRLSLRRVERLRTFLFASGETAEGRIGDALARNGGTTAPNPRSGARPRQQTDGGEPLVAERGAPVPMIVRAFGETCPIVPSPGPQVVNRRVEVFLLGPGASVANGGGCHPGRIKRTSW
jgi:flagellar motor protein MotB